MFHVQLASKAINNLRHTLPVVLCAFWFSITPAYGAPIVAKVLTYDDASTVNSVTPSSVPFSFMIYEPLVHPTPVYAYWLEDYTPADVGKSFFAPPDVVAGATTARGSTKALAVLEVNRGGFHSTPEPWWLGIPADHYISAIERIADRLEITTISQTRHFLQFSQRVRIWVEPIPEPHTIALSASALTMAYVNHLMVFGRRRQTLRCWRCPNSAGS